MIDFSQLMVFHKAAMDMNFAGAAKNLASPGLHLLPTLSYLKILPT